MIYDSFDERIVLKTKVVNLDTLSNALDVFWVYIKEYDQNHEKLKAAGLSEL